MNNVKAIRDLLGITQTTLAEGMGCTQGNVGHYERGQTVPPEAAKRLIAYAKSLGHDITFDHIYGAVELPAATVAQTPPTDSDEALADGEQPVLVLDKHTTSAIEPVKLLSPQHALKAQKKEH